MSEIRAETAPDTEALPVLSAETEALSGKVIKAPTRGGGTPAARLFDLRPVEERAQAILAAAKRCLDEARLEAQRLCREAQEEGREAGRREGLERGRREGLQEGLREAAQVRHTLLALLETLEAQRTALKVDAEQHLVALATAVAGRILKVRLEVDPGVVAANAAAALELVTGADRVCLHVAPEDAQVIQEFVPELAKFAKSARHVEVVAEAGLTRGGCVVRTADGEVDARIETQLAEIQRQLTLAHAVRAVDRREPTP